MGNRKALAVGIHHRGKLDGRRVLVVEDEPLVAIDYCNQLCGEGAEVVGPFNRAGQALAFLDTSRVDVAVVDFALADRNSEALQGALESRGIPYIVVTGYPRVLVRRDESQNVLAKPVSPEKLCTAVISACG
jgi:two-component SAPR family response regulator